MNLNLLIQNSALYSFSKILPAIFNFLLIFSISSYLGMQEYARYSNMVTISTVFGGSVAAVYGQAYLRFYTKVFEVEFLIISLLSYFFFFFTFLFSILIVPVLDAFLAIIYTTIIYYYANKVIYFQNLERPQNVIFIDIYKGIILFLTPFTFLIFFKEAMNHYLLIASSAFIFIINSLFIIKSKRKGLNTILSLNKNNWVNIKKFIKFGASLGIWIFLAGILNYVDRLFLYHYLDVQVVSIYIFWYDIVFKTSIILFIGTTMTLHARIMQSHKKGINDFSKIMRSYNILFSVILFLTSFIVILILPLAIDFFGFKNINYDTFLVLILFIGIALWQYALIFHKQLELNLKVNIMLVGVALAIIVNISFNYFLIPIMNIYGASISTVLSSFFYIIFIALFKNKSEI